MAGPRNKAGKPASEDPILIELGQSLAARRRAEGACSKKSQKPQEYRARRCTPSNMVALGSASKRSSPSRAPSASRSASQKWKRTNDE